MLTQELKSTPVQEVQLEKDVQRASNEILYAANLKNFQYPSEQLLFKEGNVNDVTLFKQNATVLSDWINHRLSSKQKNQLSRNCESLVGSFETQFPLNETTIACAAWWVEKKNDEIAAVQASQVEEKTSLYMNSEQRKNWKNFRNLSVGQALANIDINSITDQERYMKQALALGNDCSLKNANAALFFKMENNLPDPRAYDSIVKIYHHMDSCLLPNEDPTEKVHLRMGLLYLIYGKTDLAYQVLKKTQLEKEPKENSRNLFWLGVIHRKKHPKSDDNPYWDQLKQENPLSLGSLVAYEQTGKDPMSMLVSDESISLQNRGEGGWIKENIESFVFDYFVARRDKNTANNWANYVTKKISTNNPNLLLYWAVSQNKLKNYFSSIQMIARYSRQIKKYKVSAGLLDLQFPRAYLKEIVRKKSSIDPVFILSLMRQESAFDEYARSSANARGLMQILPKTAKLIRRSIHAEDLYDPAKNIDVGVSYLEKLFSKYDGRAEFVLAAYNAGAINVDKWLTRVPQDNMMLFCDFIPYRETRSYISIISRNYFWYSKLLSKSNDKLDQYFVSKGAQSVYKSSRMQALILSTTQKPNLTKDQKDLLSGIYIFGRERQKNILSLGGVFK